MRHVCIYIIYNYPILEGEYYNHEATEEESRCKQSPELATVTVWSAGNKQQGWNLGDLHLQVSTHLQQNLVTRKDTLDTSSCLFPPESKPKFSNNFVKRQQFFGCHIQKLHSHGRKRSWEQVLSTAFRLSFNWNRSMGEFMGCQEVYTCLPQKASFQYFWTGTSAFHPLDLPVGCLSLSLPPVAFNVPLTVRQGPGYFSFSTYRISKWKSNYVNHLLKHFKTSNRSK